MEDEGRSQLTPAHKTIQPVKESHPHAPKISNDSMQVDWATAQQLFAMDGATECRVTGFNRGGLLVCTEGLQGFVPVSHLVEMPADKSEDEQEHILASYVGRSLKLKIIECDEGRGRVVFSERAALARPGSRNVLLQQLQPGQSVVGVVTNITDFGVFVDLGGIEGLVHVSELSWGRVRHPADVVRYGAHVRVHVIQVEPDRSRVALSVKRLFPNPWLTAEQRYHPGMVAQAVVTSIVPFGAFARLEEGLDGLIHITEMSEAGEPVQPNRLLVEGQQVLVRVLQVDASRQRLGLSLVLDE
jgi:small subunit ribosomal protein S1